MMKKLVVFIAITLFYGCNEDKEAPANIAKTIMTYTIKQMMDNEAIGRSGFLPDESKILLSSNRSGIYNMYTVPISRGELTPVSESDSSSVFTISYFPKEKRMLFRMDGNGDEIYHIYLRDTDGSHKDLTPYEGTRANFYGWTADKKSLLFSSNKCNARYDDLYKIHLVTFTPKKVYQNNDDYVFGGISDDEKYLLLTKPIHTNDDDFYIYGMDDRSLTKINSVQSANGPENFSPDGKALYSTTEADGEFSQLMKYKIVEKTSIKVMERDWDIAGSYFTENGTYQMTYINEDAKSTIEVIEVASGKSIDLPLTDDMNITNIDFSNNSKWMTFYAGGSHSPSNLYVYNIENKKQTKLTDVLNIEIKSQDLSKAEVIRFISFDRLEIPAIYFKPHQASGEKKVPAMVWVHGGPGGRSRQGFSTFKHYMVNHGYAVLAINNRGSSGYGKTFYQMDDLNRGNKDLKDCVAGKNWLSEQPEIKKERIEIIRGSYGSYMTMAPLAYTPEEFDVGVNLFGVTNSIRTLRNIPPWWEAQKKALYLGLGNLNSVDSVRLRAISPLSHTDRLTRPLTALKGAKDLEVMQVESIEIVAGIRKNGVPVEYILCEDESHSFVKKENQIEAYSKLIVLLDTYLKKNGAESIQDGTKIGMES